MVIRFSFLALIMFLIGYVSFAQTDASASASSSYFLEETEEGTHFVQRIDWAPMNGIIRYEIILERRFGNSDRYDEFSRESSEEPFLELSIPAGNYRYKVLGYNVLNRLGAQSDYRPFEVFQAVEPRIEEISPREFFLEDEILPKITLTGENFLLDSHIYLVPIRRNNENNSEDQQGVLVPSNIVYSDIGDKAELMFDNTNLPVDRFRIVIVNPGGLTTTYDSFQVKRLRKPVDVIVSLGYAPVMTMYADNNVTELVGDLFYPLGFLGRAALIPMRTHIGNFGVELSPFYSWIKKTEDMYTFETHIFGAALSVLYQKAFLNDTLYLNLRLGGGIASYLGMQFTFDNGFSSDSLSASFPEFHAGASAQYFVYKQAFVELGLDFRFFFPKEMFEAYASPFLSIGWRF
jgi:hypothetical protein